MTVRKKVFTAALVLTGGLAAAGCYGSGSAYVGVYGAPVYGPGPWGAYPYPGRYPPVGGGVWVGAPVCCDEQDQEEVPQPAGEQESEAPTTGW